MGRAQTLINWAQVNRWERGAELGVYKGDTFFQLIESCPRLFMYGVDSWKAYNGQISRNKETGEASYGEQEPMERHAWNVMKRAQQYGMERCAILRMGTKHAATLIEDRSLDFVFIDADHTTNAVLGDILAWRPKVREGGFLIGHDADWPSVKAALLSVNIVSEIHHGNVWACEVLENENA